MQRSLVPLFFIVTLSAGAAQAKTATGKGPCRNGAECQEGVCVEIDDRSFCSKACGACPAGMACDAKLFERVGLSVCVPRATAQADKPPKEPPRLPCERDEACPGALICAQKYGARDCTLPCTEKEDCAVPPMMGVQYDFFACLPDDAKPERQACLPRKECTMNPLSCVSMGGLMGTIRQLKELEPEDPFGDPTAEAMPEPAAPPAAPPPPPGPKAMSADRFAKLLAQVKDNDFEDERNSVLRTAARANHFTCDQVGKLIATTDFADEKISALRILAPKIVDRENAHTLLTQFDFEDEKKQAEAVLAD